MSPALLAVFGVVCIVAINTLAPKVGVSAPLGLVVAGIVLSLLRFVPALAVPPEWILAGVLPLLLYSAAVSMPAMDFRRDFRAISGLSVSLVVMTSLALGWFFARFIPELGLAGGIALGAIVSPTDAVATSIVKRLGVAPRAVAVLDGESLLNDASALVLLRSAIAAAASSVSLWHVAGSFVRSVAIATAIGFSVGYVALLLRRRIPQASVNTLLSFIVPFLAYEPAEHLQDAARTLLDAPDLHKPDGSSYDPSVVQSVRERVVDAPPGQELHPRSAEAKTLVRDILNAQRERLLQVRNDGTYSSEALRAALARVDAMQLSFEHGKSH